MVQQATKEEAIPLDAHGGESGDKKTLQGGKAFKKKNSKGSYADKKTEGVPELLKGVSFSISRDGPDIPNSCQEVESICMYYIQE